ncbi:MAG: A/G-specific adenine glycosylase [Gammaproteobacteria bacterium]
MAREIAAFAPRVLKWWHTHGRKDLPWQHDPMPYRVWVSEIMLQQTQVATAINYYRAFMQRFANVQALAAADQEQVLEAWSGLGYYARARNLHHCAQQVVDELGGEFPQTIDELIALRGIGRSTAGAILSLSHDQVHPILDGNVKRVLCRHAGIDGWPGKAAVQRQLWTLAEQRLPGTQGARYTQAMMDLGATVCTARAPACESCPVSDDCVARAQDLIGTLPTPKPKRVNPERAVTFVIARGQSGAVLLERRPPSGIWGGLWCFPECDDSSQADAQLQRLGIRAVAAGNSLPGVRHTFSHFHLNITPLLLEVHETRNAVADDAKQRWFFPHQATSAALAAPVARLLASLPDHPQ